LIIFLIFFSPPRRALVEKSPFSPTKSDEEKKIEAEEDHGRRLRKKTEEED